MVKFTKLMAAFLWLSVFAYTAYGDANTLAYQGVLVKASGEVVADSSYDLVFSIWDAATDGNQVWTESHSATPVAKGAFDVQLGNSVALGSIFSTYTNLWLQIAANTGTGLEVYGTRVPLSSVPYAEQAITATNAVNAANAANADTLDGLHAAGLATVSHNHVGESITSGTISTNLYSAYSDLSAESKIGTVANGTDLRIFIH